MSNNTNFYFGPYLEVKVKERTEDVQYNGCANGHKFDTAFCPECGLPRASFVEQVSKPVYNTWHLDGYDDLHEDELASVTPPSMYGKGVILLRPNMRRVSDWLYLHGRDFNETEVKAFPTNGEVTKMIFELMNTYQDIIDFLNAHPLVISVEAKAGYVLDAEY